MVVYTTSVSYLYQKTYYTPDSCSNYFNFKKVFRIDSRKNKEKNSWQFSSQEVLFYQKTNKRLFVSFIQLEKQETSFFQN